MSSDSGLVDYEIWDADQHYYEPHDCFTRHLEDQFRGVIRWADVGDRRTFLVHGKQSMLVPNPTFDPVAAPGTMELYYRAENRDGRELRDMVRMQPMQPEYRERDARIARLDEQGVEQVWLNPTLGLGIEEMLQEDPASAVAIVRASNRWLEEDWGYNRDDRILAGPLISLIDAREAELEVDRVLEVGTRLVVMRVGPVPSAHGRPMSPADPRHDRVWAKLAEAGVVVTIHAGDAGYTRYLADWGESPRYMGKKTSPLSDVLSLGIERPIHDMMAALICHGLFDRHPTLKVATLELGSAWVPALHRKLRAAYGITRSASSAIRSRRSANTCGLRPSTRTTSNVSATATVPIASCWAPTGRIPRGWRNRGTSSRTSLRWANRTSGSRSARTSVRSPGRPCDQT